MNLDQKTALFAFGAAVDLLKQAKVIRSHRYLGDIAEFLCAELTGIDLSTNLRQVGHDGMRGELRAQIKYGGGKKTNMDLGNPANYDEIYVVLGKGSVLRTYPAPEEFIVYRLTSSHVTTLTPIANGRYSCGKRNFSRAPDFVITLSGGA